MALPRRPWRLYLHSREVGTGAALVRHAGWCRVDGTGHGQLHCRFGLTMTFGILEGCNYTTSVSFCDVRRNLQNRAPADKISPGGSQSTCWATLSSSTSRVMNEWMLLDLQRSLKYIRGPLDTFGSSPSIFVRVDVKCTLAILCWFKHLKQLKP